MNGKTSTQDARMYAACGPAHMRDVIVEALVGGVEVTANKAAELLNVTPGHVWTLIKQGKLTAVRTTPRKTTVTLASINALIKANNA